MYNRETELYDVVIRNKERQKMVDEINKIFTEHSRELIRKIQEDTSKQFKDEFARELENMEKTDDIPNYDDHKVESCVEEFSKFCEDLKEFDLDYFHNSCGVLQKQLTSHTVICILSLKEELARKASQEKEESNKNIDALHMKLDQRTDDKLRLEEEIRREQENSRRVKEEMEQKIRILEEEKQNKEKEEFQRRQDELENELEIQRERTRKLEEEQRGRGAVEEQRTADKRIEELMTKLDQRTEQRLQRDEEIQRERENNMRAMLEQEKHSREKEEFDRRQRALESELQAQKERTIRLEAEQQNKSSGSGLLGWLLG